jgi:hypothetical protein
MNLLDEESKDGSMVNLRNDEEMGVSSGGGSMNEAEEFIT